MKILILGAGATGGYFGGRLAQAGADVTFLLRPRRAEQLARGGLVIRSPLGDATVPVNAITQSDLRPRYDIVLLTCKAYDLDDAIESIRAGVGSDTGIVPLLNGMRHVDRLREAFGEGGVLGGTCHIASTLSIDGEVLHLSDLNRIRFGELDGRQSARVQALADAFAHTGVDAAASGEILQEMWEKWVLLATLAATTCTLRGSVGDILAGPDGLRLIEDTLDACARIAAAEGHPPRPPALALARQLLGERGSVFTASMLRDIERGADQIEGDHIVGDMLARGRRHGIEPPILLVADAHLRTYLARRRREHPAA